MSQKYLFFFLFFFLAACSNDEQTGAATNAVEAGGQTTVSLATQQATYQATDFKLVFFLNPKGGPCRMQDAILGEMAKELKGKVDIQYVKTSVPGDQDIFYQYGIRALPTLLLADASGKEIKRMPPGIQRIDDIRRLIQSVPQS
jgi:thioredoxin